MTEKKAAFKLPKYLRLGKGSMWFDVDGEEASGVKLYSFDEVFVGRGKIRFEVDGKNNQNYNVPQPEVAKDKFDNQNLTTYGFVEKELPWYFDTTQIPNSKLSRIIVAYKNGVLIEADPEKKPAKTPLKDPKKEFKISPKGDRVFDGKNKEIYKKLMNLKSDDLRKFIVDSPRTEKARDNLLDMLDYERKGYNSLSRPRAEILDLIRARLNEFGPGISAIRKNDLD